MVEPWTEQSTDAIEKTLHCRLREAKSTSLVDTESSERGGLISILRVYRSLIREDYDFWH